MKLNLACKRFRRLYNEGDVRDLTREERQFVEEHRDMCDECREFESSAFSSLSMLRDATMEPEVSLAFDDRVIRLVKVQSVRSRLGYWSPALVGAGIACVAIFAALQIAATPAKMNKSHLPDGEARLNRAADQPLPSLILPEKPRLDR